MAAFIANVGQRGIRMIVEVQQPDQADAMIAAVRQKLKDVRKVFLAWKKEFQIMVVRRFEAEGGTKNWASLSRLSTWPLRNFRDITRVKDVGGRPRLGGTPIQILRSRFRDYMESWINDNHPSLSVAMQTDASGAEGASMRIGNSSAKTVHEDGIKSVKGPLGFRGKKVPARPVTWLKDTRLLTKLMKIFDDFILEGLRPSKGVRRQGVIGINLMGT